MDKDTEPASERPSFWKTLPGILTAIASLITAIGGLIVVIQTFRRPVKPPPINPPISPPGHSATADNTTNAMDGLRATADDRTYTILSARHEPYSPVEYLLVLKVRVRCKEEGVNFFADLFRLDVDGLKSAPHKPGSNRWIDPNSEYAEDVEFIVPNDSHALNLQVGDAATPRTAIIPLPLDKLLKTK